MSAYYNEIDLPTAAWLRELIREGLIADGEVDTRSIVDVRPADLGGFAQCHFFAGIGGWSYALRLAGWPDDRAVWTGSCPCQPFSSAGKAAGADDSRDLWPTWFGLWRECRPVVGFGEQVASADGLGWLDRVHADLEAAGYAIGAVDLCAASVGAFHIRQRLWFVADREREGFSGGDQSQGARLRNAVERHSAVGDVAESDDTRHTRDGSETLRRAWDQQGPESGVDGRGASRGFWDACDWIPCADGKARPVEPSTFPLAHGVSARVGRLRGYGNAIVPQVAQAFIESYLDVRLA